MRLTDVLAALSDPIRVRLVRMLAHGVERGWGELCTRVAKSTLSHHMKTLRAAGVSRTRKQGTCVRLRRDDLDTRFPGLVEAVLKAAQADDVGDKVGLPGA
jgi:DNA-binding transcriptional ArsR family regulator